MSAPVDSLSIKVDASARGANQQLDTLVQKMMQLRSTVNGINVGNLNTMSVSIQNFSKAAAGLNQVRTSDFTRMAKSIEKLANIRKGELNRAATAITNISKAFSNMGNISNGAMQMGQLAQSISRLGYKSTTQAIQNIPLLTTALKDMMTQLSQAPTVSQNLINMTNAMANLGRYASGVCAVGNAMKNTETSGSRFFGMVRNSVNNIKNFVTNINSASSANRSFASTLGLLYAKFWALQRVFRLFGNAVAASTDYMEEYNYFNVVTEKIGKEWSHQWKKYGYENAEAYGDSFSARMREDIGKLTGYSISEDGSASYDVSKNLGLDLTKMTNYAAGIMNVTNSLGMTGEASIVTAQAMSRLSGDMSSFKNVDLSTVMNNFQSGLIGQSRALYKYGIDITNATLEQYAYNNGIKKSVMEMTQAEKMQLRMLAILDQSKSSWGDLANTIKTPSNQFRLFKTNVAAAGRTLGNIFLPIVAKVLPYINGLTIAVNRLLGYIFKITGLEKQYKEIMGDSGTGYTDAFDGLEEDAENAKDAVDDTTDSVKKLAKQLMGFDELNVITTNKNSDSNADSDGIGGGAIDLTDELSKALADYEKVWNEAYNNMENDAQSFADKLAKLFKDAWVSGDGSDIGSAIAKWLNKGINWVNNNQNNFSDGLNRMASMLGTALNGFVSSFNWAGLGRGIGGSIKSALEAEEKFFDTVNWVNLGSSLATSLNSAVDSGAIQQFFTTMASKLKGAIETAFGLVTTFDFEGLGSAVGQGINNFFKKMDKVNEETGLNGWQELGKTISETIGGIATSMTTALNTVNWESVGQSIADFIASIDFSKIVWNLGGLAVALGGAIFDVIKENPVTITSIILSFGAWKIASASINLLTSTVGTAVSEAVKNAVVSGSLTGSLKNFGSLVIGKIGAGLTAAKTAITGLASSIATSVGGAIQAAGGLASIATSVAAFVGSVLAVIASAIAGLEIGMLLGNLFNSDGETYHLTDLFDYDFTEWTDGFRQWGSDIKDTLSDAFTKAWNSVKNVWKNVSNWFNGNVITPVKNFFTSLGNKISSAFDTAWNGVKSVWESVSNWFNVNIITPVGDIFNGLKTRVSQIFEGLWIIVQAVWIVSSTWFNDKVITPIKNGFNTFKTNISTIFTNLWAGIKNIWGNVSNWFSNKVVTPVKNAFSTFKTNVSTIFTNLWTGIKNTWSKVSTWFSGKVITPIKNAFSTFKTNISTIFTNLWTGIKNTWSNASTWFSNKVITPIKNAFKTATDKIAEFFSSLWKGITKGMVSAFNSVLGGIEKAINWIVNAFNGIVGGFNKIVTVAAKVVGADWSGVDKISKVSISKLDVPQYATGGFPAQGQYFLARENGPELVGTIGGKTAVANNSQIVQSVSDGVFNALAPVLTQVANSVNALNSKIDNMGSSGMDVEKYKEGDLLRVVRKEDSNYKKAHGKSAFAY